MLPVGASEGRLRAAVEQARTLKLPHPHPHSQALWFLVSDLVSSCLSPPHSHHPTLTTPLAPPRCSYTQNFWCSTIVSMVHSLTMAALCVPFVMKEPNWIWEANIEKQSVRVTRVGGCLPPEEQSREGNFE